MGRVKNGNKKDLCSDGVIHYLDGDNDTQTCMCDKIK